MSDVELIEEFICDLKANEEQLKEQYENATDKFKKILEQDLKDNQLRIERLYKVINKLKGLDKLINKVLNND